MSKIKNGIQISFHRYLFVCRHYFPNTVQVFDTKSALAFKVREAINNIQTLRKIIKIKIIK